MKTLLATLIVLGGVTTSVIQSSDSERVSSKEQSSTEDVAYSQICSLQNTFKDEALSGFYKITVPEDEWHKSREILVFLNRKGTWIEMTELTTNEKLPGKFEHVASGEKVTFRFRRSENFWGDTDLGGLELNSSLTSGSMSAYFVGSFRKSELKVESIKDVWACSNHTNPTHTADSESGMRDQTAKNKCTGWHVLNENEMK